jgi:hypothetical protein
MIRKFELPQSHREIPNMEAILFLDTPNVRCEITFGIINQGVLQLLFVQNSYS